MDIFDPVTILKHRDFRPRTFVRHQVDSQDACNRFLNSTPWHQQTVQSLWSQGLTPQGACFCQSSHWSLKKQRTQYIYFEKFKGEGIMTRKSIACASATFYRKFMCIKLSAFPLKFTHPRETHHTECQRLNQLQPSSRQQLFSSRQHNLYMKLI